MPTQRLWVLGAHRGATAFFRQFARSHRTRRPTLQIVDPVPKRAEAFLATLRDTGVVTDGNAIEAHAEGVLERVQPDDAVVVAVDTFHATRDAIERVPHSARVYGQIVGRSPGHRGTYFGLALAIHQNDLHTRAQADLLLATLESLSSADRTSSRVLTGSGDALANDLLIPFRERAATLIAAAVAAPDRRPRHPLTLVLANGDLPLAILAEDDTPAPFPMMKERALELASQWDDAPRAAVAFASRARRTIHILLLDRRGRSQYIVAGLLAFAESQKGAPSAIATD